eukprot:7427464-Pyramimonas_sp.AAC.1
MGGPGSCYAGGHADVRPEQAPEADRLRARRPLLGDEDPHLPDAARSELPAGHSDGIIDKDGILPGGRADVPPSRQRRTRVFGTSGQVQGVSLLWDDLEGGEVPDQAGQDT